MYVPKVVRFVNLPANQTENHLEFYITGMVELTGRIEKIYVRRYLKLIYAFVIFELNSDAVKTVEILDGTPNKNLILDVALIGPNEKYNSYIERCDIKWPNEMFHQTLETSKKRQLIHENLLNYKKLKSS